MSVVGAIAAAIAASDGRDFGPLTAAYAAAGLALPTLWLAPTAATIALPEQRALLDWWRGLADGGLPAPAHIDPLALRAHLGNLTLVEPCGDGDFLYRIHGTKICDAVGYELTGRRVSEGARNGAPPPEVRSYFQATYQVTLQHARPLYAQAPWHTPDGKALTWHRLVLPFADGTTPERLLVSNVPCPARG